MTLKRSRHRLAAFIKAQAGMNAPKKSRKTAVLIISPETGRLPKKMSPLARYISGKSGGLGEVVAALCEGLTLRGIECHLATINLKMRFQQESNLDDNSWHHIRHRIDAKRIHLVNSSVFAHLPSAYAGNPLQNAAEFQKEIVNHIMVNLQAKHAGNLIIHSHDWMAGGAITAYAKFRGFPVLHTVHNIHTGQLPLEMLFGVEWERLTPYLYFSHDNSGKSCIDSHATAIKNANLVNFVGQQFLQELVDDQFCNTTICLPSVRQEIRAKHEYGATLAILNAPSPILYPENCTHLIRRFGPDDDILAAKRENLVEFQKSTGLQVNPEAILLYWPSRLDPLQKGVQLLEDIAHRFVIAHDNTQIAIVGDGVGNDRTHEEICGRIAWSSGRSIVYHHFNESLSMQGFAAASVVFGASLYEPCGQIDQIGNLFGAIAVNRDTGGYHDKIQELRLAIDGAPQDEGNGFLFRDYDSGGLWYGLSKGVEFCQRPLEVRQTQLKRIMKESRTKYDVNTMVDEYVRVYERLNGDRALV